MPRVNPRDPSVGTGGSGVPIFEQPTPEVLIPQPTPTTWEIPTLPDWLKPSLPSQPTGAGQVSETPSPTGGTYTSDQVDECKNCSNLDLALGLCNCALKGEPITVDPDDPDIQIPNAPTTGINCQAGYTRVLDNTTGVWSCMPDTVGTCTTCDSAICKECDAWDVPCERLHKANGTCTPASPQNPECDIGCWLTGRGCECNGNGEECGMFDFGCKIGKWWEEYGTIVMIVGGVIVLGILLWLLRPLFGIAKNITEK